MLTLLRHRRKSFRAAASDDNPGTSNLVSSWSMDETSGTRVDSHGSNDLTDNNTVGYVTGVISNAANFISANSENLSSSTQPVTGAGARAAEFWFKTSSTADQALTSYGQNANGQWWRIRIENGVIYQRVTNGAKSWSNTWNDGNWHHLVMQVDANSTIDDVVLYIDGTLQSSSGATTTQAINTGTGDLYFGREASGSIGYDGDIDECRYWNRVLTADEITWLYNSGSGRSYSDISNSNPGTANLVGDWSMDETSGTRVDSHGSNDLTDNNTVGSATGVISNASSFVSANSEYLSSTTVPVTGTGARSLEVWFKTSTGGTMHIAGFGGSNSANKGTAFRLSIENGALYCRVYQGFRGFGGSWNDGAWHQVVLKVMDSGYVGDLEMYVDGSLQTGITGSNLTSTAINTGTDLFFVGQSIQSTETYYFNGDVDILRVFNDELTADEITWLYNSGNGRSYSDISGGGSSIILEERFEESDSGGALGSSTDGYDSSLVSSEVTTTGSTIDPDESTTAVLSGSQSLEIDSASGDNYVEFDLGSDYDELWFHVEVNRRTSSVNNRIILKFFNQSGTLAADLKGNASSQPTLLANSAASAFTYANNSAVDHFWLHWVRNSTSTFYFAQNSSTRPTSGGDVVSFTAADVAIGKFQIGIFARSGNYRYDDIIVSTSEIGDDP